MTVIFLLSKRIFAHLAPTGYPPTKLNKISGKVYPGKKNKNLVILLIVLLQSIFIAIITINEDMNINGNNDGINKLKQ